MDFSVVVPTYNRRASLEGLLDILRDVVEPDEVVVVNGPSTDGTTGMVRDRRCVDILLEVAERNINVARNAGLDAATGDIVAFLDPACRPGAAWKAAIGDGIATGADMIAAPRRSDPDEPVDEAPVDGGNLAMTRAAGQAFDGFDEYLQVGGAADLADRIRARGKQVIVTTAMSVDRTGLTEPGMNGDGGRTVPFLEVDESPWGIEYRSLAYRTVKCEGIRPRVLCRILRSAVVDGVGTARAVMAGDVSPTQWIGTGWSVFRHSIRGGMDGVVARWRDQTPARNPHGISMRRDRVVERYDQGRCRSE